MLGGAASYAELPYFYTDQYDLGMEYVGYVEPGRLRRGGVSRRGPAGSSIAFWLKDRRVSPG